jgi:hypothetical protein
MSSKTGAKTVKRGKIGVGKRTVLTSQRKKEEELYVPESIEEHSSAYMVAKSLFKDLSESQLIFLDKLELPDPGTPDFIYAIQEICKALISNNEITMSLLSSNNFSEVKWNLPQMLELEFERSVNAESEFEVMRGTKMTTPCKKCGGYYFITSEMQRSAGDEGTKSYRTCVSCI